MKKKGNKKMPRPRQEIIDNPIPTSLFMCYAAVLLFVGSYWGCNFKNTCKCVHMGRHLFQNSTLIIEHEYARKYLISTALIYLLGYLLYRRCYLYNNCAII